MTIDLSELDATAQAALVSRGELRAVDLVDAAIARVEALEPRLHALASTNFELARARAQAEPKGAFGGVPLLAKDLLAVPGYGCEMGSRLFRGNVPAEGSPFTDRLEQAGFVILGKTTTSELGLLGSTETRAAGVTHNPWGTELSATGSSGGSAAAVAAGMVPMAHASDGGGSIRIPASACGVFGFKPSRGRCVSAGPGDMDGLVADLAVSRTVRDTAGMLNVVEDRDSALPTVGLVNGPSTRRLRIAVYRHTLMGEPPHPHVAEVLDRTVELCRALGHHVSEEAAPPVDGSAVSSAFFTAAGSVMAQLAEMMSGMLGRPVSDAELEPFSLSLLAWFRELPPGHLPDAMAAMHTQGAVMRKYAERFDALLCPTMPCEPPPLGFLAPDLDRETLLRRTETLAGYTAIHNMAGLPAMSVPVFRSTSGLPIGSHFAAPLGQDATLLALAYELEAAAPWRGSYASLRPS